MKDHDQAARRLAARSNLTTGQAYELFKVLKTTDVLFALSVIDIAQFYERDVFWTAAMIKQTIRRS